MCQLFCYFHLLKVTSGQEAMSLKHPDERQVTSALCDSRLKRTDAKNNSLRGFVL